ncbi:MAG: glycosyltransferase family 2 protein [Candidatus Beckwithbacteria bacterium]|nr:glycosyltransferase family 2 protein [Candidatus Beckwithbacteria bacterium]
MDLSIIIVNYKTKDLTLQTLKSVFQAQPPKGKMEVILVDNASDDDTTITARKLFPPIKIIDSQTNIGFAGGNNLGIRQAKGRYVLLLNSDTLIEADTLVKMVEFMDNNPKAGLSTCQVKLLNGELDPASHRGFPTPWAAFTYFLGLEKIFPSSRIFGQYHLGCKNLREVHEIDSPSGAFFMLKKRALDQVGLLDETFFMYGEDIDLAYRLKKAGWQIIYTPITKIIHLKGASGISSSSKSQRLKTTASFFNTMKIFYHKHYQKKYLFLIKWLVFLGIDMVKLIKNIKIKLS